MTFPSPPQAAKGAPGGAQPGHLGLLAGLRGLGDGPTDLRTQGSFPLSSVNGTAALAILNTVVTRV